MRAARSPRGGRRVGGPASQSGRAPRPRVGVVRPTVTEGGFTERPTSWAAARRNSSGRARPPGNARRPRRGRPSGAIEGRIGGRARAGGRAGGRRGAAVGSTPPFGVLRKRRKCCDGMFWAYTSAIVRGRATENRGVRRKVGGGGHLSSGPRPVEKAEPIIEDFASAGVRTTLALRCRRLTSRWHALEPAWRTTRRPIMWTLSLRTSSRWSSQRGPTSSRSSPRVGRPTLRKSSCEKRPGARSARCSRADR